MQIIFNGLLDVSEQIKIIVPNVTLYGGESYNGTEMGCLREQFNTLVANTKYQYDFDDECFYLRGFDRDDENNPRVIGGNIREGEEWIWFEGKPLQYINLCDKHNVKIFSGDYCKWDDGFAGVVEYEPQGGCFIVRNHGTKKYKEFKGGQSGSEDGIRQDNIETFGNMIMYINQECAGCGRKRNHCVCP